MTRRALLVGVVLLYVASIPWYRGPDSPVEIWLGLPDWVAVALGCYVAAAVLNALAWYRADVPDRETPPPESGAGATRSGAGATRSDSDASSPFGERP